MFLTCCNFIHPEHPSVTSTDNGVREYAVNYVLHHWRDIKAEHLDVEQQTEVMETFAPLMLDKSSFARIQEEELKTTFSHDEKFDDSFFNRLRSWAALLPDMKVPLSTEAAEWLQDAVDLNSAEASFSAGNGALRICGKGTILGEQARENFAFAVGDISGALSTKQAVLGLDAQIETKPQDAAASYELARSIDPSNLVMCDALRAQMKLFENETCKQGLIATLKTWSPLERLAYLCWDTWDSVYKAVIRAAVESGEVAFIVQMCPDSIRLLEQVNASAPLLDELGFLHVNATRDPEAARTVFDQALESGSTGWPYAVAGEALEATLDTANTFQSEVLYRLFRESADRKRKRELLDSPICAKSRLDPNLKDENAMYDEEERSDDGFDDGGDEDSVTRLKGDESDLDDDIVLF
ncbi:hypothetical protein K4K48_009451 [Colletotrichum sp. SAR 10_66]|nr:hypothetical protein K4K51_009232 [Colletotrichum sp. SAR 10_75]KAJ4995866.1 hypothetical protein K4K48_009451 [Colletotrichum sp. SAR 10_66]